MKQYFRTAFSVIAGIIFLVACGGGGGGGGGGSQSSSAKAITSFSLNGVAGSINESGKSILVNMPVGTDLTSLIASFSSTGTSVKIGATTQVTGTTPNNFANPVIYTVTAGDSSTANYTVTVTATSSNQAPAAPTVSLSYGSKQITLSWNAVSGADYYQVEKNPDGASGYAQLGGNISATTFAELIPVHLSNWVNLSYKVLACNASGCTASMAVNAVNSALAIGYVKSSTTSIADQFGRGLALSSDGNTLAVGASQEYRLISTGNGDLAGAVYIYIRDINSGLWGFQSRIKPSNYKNNDPQILFGEKVALSNDGNTLVVGAPWENSDATGITNGINNAAANINATNSGAAYVFTRSGGVWTQQAYLKASNTNSMDYFGNALGISADGNTIAIGAYGESSNATGIDGNQADNSKRSSGAAYVFTRSGVTWTQQAYIKASNTDAGDYFGKALALSADGNTLAVGAINESSNAKGINGSQTNNSSLNSGAVYAFTRSGITWTQQAYIKESNSANNDYFGSSIALSNDGSTMAVGAPDEYISGTWIGGVYVFVRSNTVWSEQAILHASNKDSNDSFGGAVALSADGNILAVGAMGEASNATGVGGDQSNNSASFAGATYVFSRGGASWSQLSYVKASNTDGGDSFGRDVSLSATGETLAVSAVDESSNATGVGGNQADNSAGTSGAVYLY